jgi:hypothetical protein
MEVELKCSHSVKKRGKENETKENQTTEQNQTKHLPEGT